MPPEWDCWTTLGLSRRCRPATAKKQYKTLVKQHHPDVGGSIHLFRAIHQAYQEIKQHFSGKGITL
jgi:curved DNA-binding protein CbpA